MTIRCIDRRAKSTATLASAPGETSMQASAKSARHDSAGRLMIVDSLYTPILLACNPPQCS